MRMFIGVLGGWTQERAYERESMQQEESAESVWGGRVSETEAQTERRRQTHRHSHSLVITLPTRCVM